MTYRVVTVASSIRRIDLQYVLYVIHPNAVVNNRREAGMPSVGLSFDQKFALITYCMEVRQNNWDEAVLLYVKMLDKINN